MRKRYDHCQTVWLRLGTPDREPGRANFAMAEKVGEFMNFLLDEKICPARGMMSGAGHYEALFWVDDWPKLEVWLKEHDFEHGTTEPERDEKEYWADFEQMGG